MPSFLTKQVGPFPVVVWLGVAAGGMGLAYVLNRNTPSDSADVDVIVPTQPFPGTGGVYPQGAVPTVIVTSPPATTGTGTSPPPEAPIIPTMDDWRSLVTARLVATGVDALLASNALGKALQQRELTAAECAVVRDAIKLVPPPQPLPPIQCAPAAPAPPPPGTTTPATPVENATFDAARFTTPDLFALLRRSTTQARQDFISAELYRRGVKLTDTRLVAHPDVGGPFYAWACRNNVPGSAPYCSGIAGDYQTNALRLTDTATLRTLLTTQTNPDVLASIRAELNRRGVSA